jgi:hypothetical protein
VRGMRIIISYKHGEREEYKVRNHNCFELGKIIRINSTYIYDTDDIHTVEIIDEGDR